MKEIEAKDKNEQQQKEQEQYKAMKVVREMYARGYEFAKIDVFKCRATKFCIVDGKLMPSLNKIDGLGDNVRSPDRGCLQGRAVFIAGQLQGADKMSEGHRRQAGAARYSVRASGIEPAVDL